MQRLPAAAIPPEAMLTPKNIMKSFLGSVFGYIFLMASLNDKLKACVGK
jgi:hypothetical protein